MLKSGFGLAYIKHEGKAIHPDDDCWDYNYNMSDKMYIKQAKAYIKDTGDTNTSFIRSELEKDIYDY